MFSTASLWDKGWETGVCIVIPTTEKIAVFQWHVSRRTSSALRAERVMMLRWSVLTRWVTALMFFWWSRALQRGGGVGGEICIPCVYRNEASLKEEKQANAGPAGVKSACRKWCMGIEQWLCDGFSRWTATHSRFGSCVIYQRPAAERSKRSGKELQLSQVIPLWF